jgi:hypothetical protein
LRAVRRPAAGIVRLMPDILIKRGRAIHLENSPIQSPPGSFASFRQSKIPLAVGLHYTAPHRSLTRVPLHRPRGGWWDLERENLQLIVEVIDPLTVNPTPIVLSPESRCFGRWGVVGSRARKFLQTMAGVV